MSQPANKHSENIAGPWYCTKTADPSGEGCIACSVCYSCAPDFFKEDKDGNAYVYKQPTTEEEIALCQEQLTACPVTSIGTDGE